MFNNGDNYKINKSTVPNSQSKRILGYARPHIRLLFLIFILSILMIISSLINPYLLKILIDDVFIAREYSLLMYILAAFICVLILGTCLYIIYNYYITLFAEKIIKDIRQELFDHVESLGLDFYSHNKTGDIISRILGDTQGVQEYILLTFNGIILNIITLIAIFIIAFTISWQLTLISLFIMPFYFWSDTYFGARMKKQKRDINIEIAGFISFLEEHTNFIKLIKRFNMEKYESNMFNTKADGLLRQNVGIALTRGYNSSFIAIASFLPLLLIMLIGSYEIFIGILTIGGFIAVYTYISKMFDPIGGLYIARVNRQASLASVQRVFEFLDQKPKICEIKEPISVEQLKGEIEFKNVKFSYGKKVVFDNISFKVKMGEKIYILGPSGIGKTSIVDLIFRLYDVDEGQIFIDGIDVRHYKIETLRQRLGVIGQEIMLFNNTISYNIKFGKISASDDEIKKAADRSCASYFINELSSGYETNVGPNGANLSGGQKQLISIARTVLKNPDIYIFDEIATGLDPVSQKHIYESIDKVTQNKTTIWITHKSISAHGSARILFIHDGKLVEDGSYKELMERKGFFYNFFVNDNIKE
ncbi:MAG: ABC transporter ATP-binding protein [Methanobacteriota archaeon]